MKNFKVNILIAAILVGTLLSGCSSKAVATMNEEGTSDTISVSQDNTKAGDEYAVNDSDYEEVPDTKGDSESTADADGNDKNSDSSKTFSAASGNSESSESSKSPSKANSNSESSKSSSKANSNSESSKSSSQTSSNCENSKSSSGTISNSDNENNSVYSESQSTANSSNSSEESDKQTADIISLNTSGILDTSEMFSTRDLTQTVDTSGAKAITVSDNKTIDITEESVYVISGSAKNCTIKVNADKEAKVQLILDGINITNDSTPAIYVVSADKCFVTTTNSENTLTVTGSFTADGDTKTDAVIFSKDDIVLNGVGTLNINSTNNGISGKDDLKITSGTYNITSTADSIEANDSIRICGGTFNIRSSKDAIHSENDDDDTKGYVYISGGSFNINAVSDAIQGTTAVQIDGGTFELTATEGIEGTYVQINDGTINITASDDGINGAQKIKSYSTPTIEINGGNVTITMGQGDTDAIDSNGNIIVNGGRIDITAQISSFDYDCTAKYNGGTIIINGSQVDSIPQSMMGGRSGMGNMNGGLSGKRNRSF